MIYLYVTPSGSVNLIEGDKMPVKPERPPDQIETYKGTMYFGGDVLGYEPRLKKYEKALAAAKASSVPVDDQEGGKEMIYTSGLSEMNDHLNPQPDTFYGPFDIGYEIGHRCTYLQTDGKCDDCFRNNLCAKVAILLPEKELVKQDAKSDQEIEDAATLYANVHYGDRGKITYPEAIAVWECGLEDFIAGAKWAKGEPVGKLEEKEEVSPRVAKLLLGIRDELAKLDQCPEEAYHLLYQIASPNFDKTEPWAELEKIAKRDSL